jgi:hypothetical protein
VVPRRRVRCHSYCTCSSVQRMSFRCMRREILNFESESSHLISSHLFSLRSFPSLSFLSSLLFLYLFSFLTFNLSFPSFLFFRLFINSLFSPLCFHSPIGHFSLVPPNSKPLFHPFHIPLSTHLELFQSNSNNIFKQV